LKIIYGDEHMGIIAVSDIHLGYMDDNNKQSLSDIGQFSAFLKYLATRNDIDHFVICGDLLDMWRRDMLGLTEDKEIHPILELLWDLQSKMDVIYLAGNHDYHIRDLNMHHYPYHLTDKIDPKAGKIIPEKNGKTYLFKHGYDFEFIMRKCEKLFDPLCFTNDEEGEFLSWLWDHLKVDRATKQLFEDLREMTIEERMQIQGNGFDFGSYKVPENYDVLVFGHTHKPFYSQNKINLGSWITSCPIHNTYLEIMEDQERLLKWPKNEPINIGPIPETLW
jgi:UDP-2,3-diacylglucosamine pyrophosphatase LpxH